MGFFDQNWKSIICKFDKQKNIVFFGQLVHDGIFLNFLGGTRGEKKVVNRW